ncbi:F0F1 ATP synthase subunit epsilon [Vagococcus elongatus]|uniref:ATP synthase epsilon chain n=1 Tax=Vagococcus elongatus TaxID=180344 RepID=A0A430AX37_9ENTE|nr:F0F1 ATP synthase subunit epsilon [Vagococcus elongatus]RSU12618.1 F0F1 ATP synthase subunit epsilon [Vagococcus elongatus]
MSKLHIQVVTPDGLVFDGDAGFLVARTPEGEIGIMSNHLPLIVPLAIDSLVIKEERGGKIIMTIAVNGGIMEVRDNQVSILADSAEQAGEIDLDRAMRAKERAERNLEKAKKDHHIDNMKRAEVALNRAINRIHVSRK